MFCQRLCPTEPPVALNIITVFLLCCEDYPGKMDWLALSSCSTRCFWQVVIGSYFLKVWLNTKYLPRVTKPFDFVWLLVPVVYVNRLQLYLSLAKLNKCFSFTHKCTNLARYSATISAQLGVWCAVGLTPPSIFTLRCVILITRWPEWTCGRGGIGTD